MIVETIGLAVRGSGSVCSAAGCGCGVDHSLWKLLQHGPAANFKFGTLGPTANS